MSKYVVNATWEDAPHISPEQVVMLMESLPPHELEARSKGIPSLGAGAIYPVTESTLYTTPFAIPKYWPKAAGMDVGWNRTAVVWGALDEESDILYIYREHYLGKELPSTHANAILSADRWVNIAIDPASGGSSQVDGKRLLELYADLNLNLYKADNSVESGILKVWQRMSSGRLKIFNHLQNLQSELRVYRRDLNGKVADKQSDHACDALRYLVNTLDQVLSTNPDYDEYTSHEKNKRRIGEGTTGSNSSRNRVTGY